MVFLPTVENIEFFKGEHQPTPSSRVARVRFSNGGEVVLHLGGKKHLAETDLRRFGGRVLDVQGAGIDRDWKVKREDSLFFEVISSSSVHPSS